MRSPYFPFLFLALSLGCGPRARPSDAARARAQSGSTPFFSPGKADSVRKARIEALAPQLDDYFQHRLESRKATGLSVGIVLDGELVYAKGFGVSDVRSKSPVHSDTVFRIASLTKSVTAAAVLKLRDEGKISLDAPIASYLPELSSLALPTRDSPPVTVRLLLTHAAGLPWDDSWGPVSFGLTEQDLAVLTSAGLSFSSVPGLRFEYSNLGYALLGRIVERVSGTPFRDYVTANILQPLGMTSTVWGARDVSPARLAVGYRSDHEKLVPEATPPPGIFGPAGGLYTSAHDYARYVAWHLAAYPPRDDPEAGPLRRSTLREMHAGQRSAREVGNESEPLSRRTDDGIALSVRSYGFGWFNVTTCKDESRVEHSGWEPGYISAVILLPKQGFGIFSMATTNGVGAIEGAVDLLREAGALPPVWEPAPSQELVEARDALTRLVNQWDAGLVARTFDPTCANYPWYPHLREDLAKLSQDHGRCRPDGPLKAYGRLHGSWRLSCERGSIALDVGLAPTAKPRVERVWWEEEFPPDERLSQTARRLVDALNHASGDSATGLLDASIRRAGTKTLERLAVEHGTCSIERPIGSDGHRTARFLLRCSEAPLELALTIDTASGQVIQVSGARPRAADAICWQ